MPKHFTVDARTVLTLGRDSIKDHTTALIELVKNSYDADAGVVEIDIFSAAKPESNYIRIADNGSGMSEEDVDTRWLRIGYSEKLKNTLTDDRGRRKTGEKGIGRLSADRLGAMLKLSTQAKGHDPVGLIVNWNDFNTPGRNLATIAVKAVSKPAIKLPPSDVGSAEATHKTGTELVAEQLRHRWTAEDIRSLYEELSILTPPFEAVKDFEIHLKTDVLPELDGKVQSPFLGNAVVELTASFDGKSTIEYDVVQRGEGGDKGDPQSSSITWNQLFQRIASSKQIEIFGPTCGPVKIVLMFFPRKADTVRDTSFSLSDLREFLDRNSGVRVYRDNIRVKPYGDPGQPEGDWLKLGERKARDPAGAARKSFKVSPNQLVGAVFISRDDNPSLVDSSSREGLIHGQPLSDLKSLVLGCVSLLETTYHDAFTKQKTESESEQSNAKEEVQSLGSDLQNLATGLREAKNKIPKTSERKVERALDQIDSVIEKINAARKSIEKLASQPTVYRGLATIGIAATVFGHETLSAISQFAHAADAANLLLEQTPPNVDEAVDELQKAQSYAERVGSWGSFALARVKRDKRRRRNVDIKALVEKVLKEMKPIFDSTSITMSTTLSPVSCRTFSMDVESVLVNLLTNAYAACQQEKRPRRIAIDLKPKINEGTKGFELAVSDSGPGVAEKFANRVWEPLFSTKLDTDGAPTGTGLGLSIVQSVVDELKGTRMVDRDPELKGARFKVWLPLG